MEVLVGPTFSIEVSSPPSYVASPPQDKPHVVAASCLFVKEDDEEDSVNGRPILSSSNSGSGLGLGLSLEDSSDSSSSIGTPDDSDEEEEDEKDGVVSPKQGLGSFDSLEESLPIKRGLSNHFTGKSKSFANLSDVSSSVSGVKDLEKPENPFNKRRRILMANKWSRKSFYSWSNPKSMPLLTLNEDEGDDDHQRQEEHHEEEDQENSSSSETEKHKDPKIRGGLLKLQERRFKNSFKSHSCFSLTDLQEEEEEPFQ